MQGRATDVIPARLLPLTCMALLVMAGNATATSSDLYDRYFSNVLAGPPCYARTYDDVYLKAHPAQRVRSIEVDLSKANSDGTPNSSNRFELGFALVLATGAEWYGQAASCTAEDSRFECFLEGDGGLFRLTPIADGGLRFDIGDTGIALEGTSDSIEISGTTGGDRTFDLTPSQGECEAARAFFGGGGD